MRPLASRGGSIGSGADGSVHDGASRSNIAMNSGGGSGSAPRWWGARPRTQGSGVLSRWSQPSGMVGT